MHPALEEDAMRRIKVSEAVRGGRGKEGEQHISTPASRNLNLSKFRSLVIMVDAQKNPSPTRHVREIEPNLVANLKC
jgi:hypothetical protein